MTNANSNPGEKTVKDLDGSGKSTTRILAVTNPNTAFNSAFSYLKKKGFELKVVNTLMEGISEITNSKPDILILSWNLKGTDIKKVSPVLTKRFSVICFILGEDDSSKTSSPLLASGLPNAILYPIGGVNLYNRIQTSLGRSISNVKQKEVRKRLKTKEQTLLGGTQYKRPKKSDIPPDAVWNIRINSTNSTNQIWETVIYSAGKPQFFYYKGDRPPDKWMAGSDEVQSEKIYTFMSDSRASADLLSSFQSYTEISVYESESEEILDIDVIERHRETIDSQGGISFSSNSETEKLQFTKADSRATPLSKSILEKCVQTSIEQAFNHEQKTFASRILINKITNLTVAVIRCSTFEGYLVLGQASDTTNISFVELVFQNLVQEMKKEGQVLDNVCDVLEVKIDEVSLDLWLERRAAFKIQLQLGQEDSILAYLPADVVTLDFIDQDLVPIPISHIEMNKSLDFDVFLHLPLNKKHLLYLKNGSIVSDSFRDRLTLHNTNEIFLKKSDEKLFFKYTVVNGIEKSSVEKFIQKKEIKK